MKKLVVFTLVFLMGCGSGGGGSSSSAKFAGVWRGTFRTVTNSCNLTFLDEETVLTVNEEGSRVVVDSSSGRHYEGVTAGEDAFTAYTSDQAACVNQAGQPVTEKAPVDFTLDFRNVQGDSTTVTVQQEFGNCGATTVSAGTQCTVFFAADMVRD